MPRVRFLPAAGAKILAMLTVNHYICPEIDATHTLLITTMELAPSKLVLVETTQVNKRDTLLLTSRCLLGLQGLELAKVKGYRRGCNGDGGALA